MAISRRHCSSSLSLWERVRVRDCGINLAHHFQPCSLTPAPLPKGEGMKMIF